MSGMERAIEHATKVIGDLPGFTDEQVRGIAEDLADAGLLAPAPLREEWEAVIGDSATVVCDSLDEAQGYGGHIYRRHVTEWLSAEEGS